MSIRMPCELYKGLIVTFQELWGDAEYYMTHFFD